MKATITYAIATLKEYAKAWGNTSEYHAQVWQAIEILQSIQKNGFIGDELTLHASNQIGHEVSAILYNIGETVIADMLYDTMND